MITWPHDLRETLALNCKVPMPGDRLLDNLREVYGDCDPIDDEGAFLVGDGRYFERRGIECKQAA